MGGDEGKGKGKGDFKGGSGGGKKGQREEKEWVPCTKLGRLVKGGQITTIEDIYLHSLPIKEFQIVDILFPAQQLKDDVMKIMPVQKQTSAGQNSRFVCYVAVGDSNGHIGLGNKCAKEVATAIRGGIIAAKLNLIPVRRGYWGNKIGLPHTVAMKVHGKCGSVRMRRSTWARRRAYRTRTRGPASARPGASSRWRVDAGSRAATRTRWHWTPLLAAGFVA